MSLGIICWCKKFSSQVEPRRVIWSASHLFWLCALHKEVVEVHMIGAHNKCKPREVHKNVTDALHGQCTQQSHFALDKAFPVSTFSRGFIPHTYPHSMADWWRFPDVLHCHNGKADCQDVLNILSVRISVSHVNSQFKWLFHLRSGGGNGKFCRPPSHIFGGQTPTPPCNIFVFDFHSIPPQGLKWNSPNPQGNLHLLLYSLPCDELDQCPPGDDEFTT